MQRVILILLLVSTCLVGAGCSENPPKTLLFTARNQQGVSQVWREFADGSGKELVAASGERPRWQPGAKEKFAFVEREPGNAHLKLWVAEPDGSNPTALTGFEIGSEFSWSPDGEWIAVAHTKDGNYEIYKLKVDGSQAVRMTDNFATDTYPRWSPTGDKIAFVSTRNNDEDIYVIDANGPMNSETNLIPSVDGSAEWDRGPAWSSDGKAIAFLSSRYKAGGGGTTISVSTVDVATLQITELAKATTDVAPLWEDKFVLYYSGHELHRYDTSSGSDASLGWFAGALNKAPLTSNASHVYITKGDTTYDVHIYGVQHYTGDVTDLGVGYAPDVW